jgi:hypothetical protein
VKIVSALSLVGLGLLLWAMLGHEAPQISIQNSSGIPIDDCRIVVDGQVVARGNLGSGVLDRQGLPGRQEGALRLQLRFSDGRRSEFDLGWFSPAQSEIPDVVVFSPDSVFVRRD